MMKLFQKVLALVICSITISNVAAAQNLFTPPAQLEKACEVEEFTSVCIVSDFQVTLQEGSCAVKLKADEALVPYILVAVRDSVLYLEYDEKSVPRDVKKVYRGKNAAVPVMKVSITAPCLNGITAMQNATVSGFGTVFSDALEIHLTDKATLKNIRLDTESAKVEMDKNSVADFNLSAEAQLELSLEDKSQLKLQYKTRNLLVHQVGNATAILTGESSTATFAIAGYAKNRCTNKGNVLVVEAGGNADVSLAGQTGDLTLTSERSAKTDALEMKASRVKATLNGWTSANVHAEEFLSVDLSGGSTLHYSGIPAIQVDKIVKSTLVHIEENE